MKNIVITGGLGFIGNELARQLMNTSRVHIIDNGNRIAPDIDDIKHLPIYHEDITDAPVIEKIIKSIKPETVFHLAAIHFIPECNANPEHAASPTRQCGMIVQCVRRGNTTKVMARVMKEPASQSLGGRDPSASLRLAG